MQRIARMVHRHPAIVMLAGLVAIRIAPLPARGEPPKTQPAASQPASYLRYEAFVKRISALAGRAGDLVQVTKLATTAGGRDVHVLTLAAPSDRKPEHRTAVLLVGGVDAEMPAASDLVLMLAEKLVDQARTKADSPAAKLLREHTFYVVPRLNPDGIEAYFTRPQDQRRTNARGVDNDRDRLVDEDGPNDLDGDGVIAVMRVPDPKGAWIVDPQYPRLMRKADPARGEAGRYRLLLEGTDDDDDGQVNEDPPGGIDDDRNWPHLFESGTIGVGIYQLSEPETRALAQFVVDHANIALAIVYGRNDNIVRVPKDKGHGPAGRSYRQLHPDDIAVYEHISQRFRRLTGLKHSPGSRPEGTLYAWLYAQRGIPTFAVCPWYPVDVNNARVAQKRPTAASRPQSGPAKNKPSETKPKIKRAERSHDPLLRRVEATKEGIAWLKYADARGRGFIEWHAFDHPTLGQVEIGGFAPYFLTTPPPDELATLADAQYGFVEALDDLLPAPHFAEPKVTHVGGNVWQVELRLTNDGYLPTHLAISRYIRNPQIVIRPQLPAERVVGGPRLARVSNLPGSGKVVVRRWLVTGKPGDKVAFRMFNRTYGEQVITVELVDSAPAQPENKP